MIFNKGENMKKGFTMIELIFVIVILGILASVAIPRLSATRTDAEISSAVANVRTLMSDFAAYHVTSGGFAKNGTNYDFKAMTNVPLKQDGIYFQLKVGSQEDCIEGILMDKNSAGSATTTLVNPIGIQFIKGTTKDSVCQAVQNSQALNSAMNYDSETEFCAQNDTTNCTKVKNFVALESGVSVY